MRMVWGSAVAYWLSGIINPAFVAIAVMIALFIPILIAEYFSPDPSFEQLDMSYQPDINHHPQQFHQPHQLNHANHESSTKSSRKLLTE